MPDLDIAIILGSTRPGRNGKAVADWVTDKAAARTAARYELVDLLDYPLPHLDEALPPAMGQYAGEHTKAWARKIGSYDGFVFVTPEYNHSTSGVLKNAIDYLHAEWNNKAAAFVSYGSLGGARAIEHLRGILSELQVAARAPAAQLLDVHRLRELLRLRTGPQHDDCGRRPVRPARSLGAGDEDGPRLTSSP